MTHSSVFSFAARKNSPDVRYVCFRRYHTKHLYGLSVQINKNNGSNDITVTTVGNCD